FEKHFGLANHEFNVTIDANTKFDVASISKQFTAALILKYWEEGLIDLEAPILNYLPYYREDTGAKVKIKHLLTHQSGIPNYTSLPGVWKDSLRNHYTFKYLIKNFCSENLEFEPGKHFQYNNSGYALLAAIIEEISKKPFEVVIEEKLLKPLGLENTGISSRESIIQNKAYGYYNLFEKWQNANYTFMQNLNGAGSMYATTSDLYKWTTALHNGSILSNKAYKMMFDAYTRNNNWIPPYKNAYGFGIGMMNTEKEVSENENDWNMFFHSGHISGFSSFIAYYPEGKHSIILLSNTDGIRTSVMHELSIAVAEVLKKEKMISSGK
ncbi:MAG: serine hydrolase domain-containing protein, partial [Bacteroidota bacterium]